MLTMATNNKFLKIVIIGDPYVGKTSLMQRYCKDQFSEEYKVTIGVDFMTRNVTIGEQCVTLQIWDTAGQDRFNSLSSIFYRGTDACVLVYDCTKRESFKNLGTWRDEFIIHSNTKEPEKIPFVVLGNKVDKLTREVDRKRAESWCKREHAGYPYFETSAKLNISVEEAFDKISQLALENSPNDKEEIEPLPSPSRSQFNCC